MEKQKSLEHLLKEGICVYIYNMDECKLISRSVPNSRFSSHSLSQVFEMAYRVFNLLQKCGKYELVADISENILFSEQFESKQTSTQVRNSLRRFENFVQAIGFLLYGYRLQANKPNYYNGSGLPKDQKGMSIKDSHLQVLIRGEAGGVHPSPLPLLNGCHPFVAPDDTLQNDLLHTILLFRGKQMHPGEIDYNYYELYNVGGVASKAIKLDLAVSALLMIEYHYQELENILGNNN